MRFFTYLIISALFLSCANTGKKISKKTYSAEVENSFENIEREKAIELYKKLRWENWKKIQRKRKALKPRRTVRRKKTGYYRPKKKVVRKKRTKPALAKEQVKELQIEISQNMSFFCMAKRKDRRFKNENECHAFTQNVLDKCQDKVQQPWVDRKIIGCVKRRLK